MSGDNDGTRWARVLRGMERVERVTDWNDQPVIAHTQMRMRGEPEPDLSPIPEGAIPAAGITTTEMMSGKVHAPIPCSQCGEPCGVRATAGPSYGSLLCEACSDPRELSWVRRPKGRPRKITT